MFLTKGSDQGPDQFDWDKYFRDRGNLQSTSDGFLESLLQTTRQHLQENESKLGFAFHKVMHSLFSSITLRSNPRILELGAASGYLTRWMVQRYGGHGTLVDKSEEAYNTFMRADRQNDSVYTYVQDDVFTVNFNENKFDVAGSFGLIEHFVVKDEIIQAHKRHVTPDGFIVLLIPFDSPLTRTFYEVNHELNTGYRELLTEKELKLILLDNGLEILSFAKSDSYVYDFGGAVCRLSR